MHTFKTSLLIIFIAIMNIVGCAEDESPCGKRCRGEQSVGVLGGTVFCPRTKEDCKCAAKFYDCNKFSFKKLDSGLGDCRVYDCVCEFRSFVLGGCPSRKTTQQDITLSEFDFVTVFPLGEACDVIASADTENNCEDLTIDRGCESSEFIPAEDDGLLNECWLYDCQQCLL